MKADAEPPQAKFEADGPIVLNRRNRCEACETEVRWVAEPSRYALLATNLADGLDIKIPTNMLLVSIAICPNCGHIRLFDPSVSSA